MKILNNKRSTWILNLLIAIVITLTVNFSYLLSMMVEQRRPKPSPKSTVCCTSRATAMAMW